MSNRYSFCSLLALSHQRDHREAFGSKNTSDLFPGPEAATPDFSQGPESNREHSSYKNGYERYLQRFRRGFEHDSCRSLPRLRNGKCLLLNGDGVLLKEIVVEFAIALRSSRKAK